MRVQLEALQTRKAIDRLPNLIRQRSFSRPHQALAIDEVIEHADGEFLCLVTFGEDEGERVDADFEGADKGGEVRGGSEDGKKRSGDGLIGSRERSVFLRPEGQSRTYQVPPKEPDPPVKQPLSDLSPCPRDQANAVEISPRHERTQ